MKCPNVLALKQYLITTSPQQYAPVFLLVSSEHYPRKEAEELLINTFVPKGISHDLALTVLSGEGLAPAQLADELQMMSMFCPRRLCIVHDADALNSAAVEVIIPYCDKPNPAVTLVLSMESINRSTTLYKRLEKAGMVLDIAEEKAWQKEKVLEGWLAEKGREAKKQIAPDALKALLRFLGTDQQLLDNELEKLVCYTGDRTTITVQDVQAVCVRMPLETVWQLGEAVFTRNSANALRVMRDLLSNDNPLLTLLRQLRSQFQTEFKVCSILAGGGHRDEVSRMFPYMNGNILERHIQMASSYGMEAFKNGLLAIDAAELKVKNSGADHDLIADQLMVTLTTL